MTPLGSFPGIYGTERGLVRKLLYLGGRDVHHTGGNHDEKGPDCRGYADPGSVSGGVGVMGPDGLDGVRDMGVGHLGDSRRGALSLGVATSRAWWRIPPGGSLTGVARDAACTRGAAPGHLPSLGAGICRTAQRQPAFYPWGPV